MYGARSLSEIEVSVATRATELGLSVEFFQSNHEGCLIDKLQESAPGSSGIIINGGALTHYGRSLADALVDTQLPIVEVHLSNIYAREVFRHRSVIAPIATGQITGLGWQAYIFALEYLAVHLKVESNE